MGFSDSLKKATGQILGATGIQQSINMFSSGGGDFSKRAKEGRLGSGDLLNVLSHGWGDTSKNMIEFMSDPSSNRLRELFSESWKSQTGALLGANLGHQAIMALRGKSDDTSPPMVEKAPSSGATQITAKKQAKERAQAAAMARSGQGLSGTIATTALGLQGDGAASSSRRLIGA